MSKAGSMELKNASVGMALMDAAPVVCFAVSMGLVASLFPSALFGVGAALCVLAGLGKVLWKLVLAVSGRNVALLNRQFLYLMCTGFGLLVLAVALRFSQIDWALVWAQVAAFPAGLFLILGVLGFVAMFYFGAKLDFSTAKANWIEQGVNLFAQVCLLLGVLCIRLG